MKITRAPVRTRPSSDRRVAMPRIRGCGPGRFKLGTDRQRETGGQLSAVENGRRVAWLRVFYGESGFTVLGGLTVKGTMGSADDGELHPVRRVRPRVLDRAVVILWWRCLDDGTLEPFYVLRLLGTSVLGGALFRCTRRRVPRQKDLIAKIP